MIVRLRQPTRELVVDDVPTVDRLLEHLGLQRESHLVIRNGTLVPGDARLGTDDMIEIRPVVSGG